MVVTKRSKICGNGLYTCSLIWAEMDSAPTYATNLNIMLICDKMYSVLLCILQYIYEGVNEMKNLGVLVVSMSSLLTATTIGWTVIKLSGGAPNLSWSLVTAPVWGQFVAMAPLCLYLAIGRIFKHA